MPPSDDDVRVFADDLRQASRVVLTTHVRPTATPSARRPPYTKSHRRWASMRAASILSDIPRSTPFCTRASRIACSIPAMTPRQHLQGIDTLLVCDTGTWSQLPGLRQAVEAFGGRKLVLDHHLTQEAWADRKLVDTSAGAAAEVAMRVIDALEVTPDATTATALFTAMATDTGWFGYSNASSQNLRPRGPMRRSGCRPRRPHGPALPQRAGGENQALRPRTVVARASRRRPVGGHDAAAKRLRSRRCRRGRTRRI